MRHNKRRKSIENIWVVSTTLAAILAALSVYQNFHLVSAREPQRRRETRTRTPSVSKQPPDKYSRFSHESHGKNAKDPRARSLKCSDCHTIPSAAAPDKIAAATKINVALGYPYHDSCLRCHEQQFYRGDRPVICTVCHARVAVRLTSRDIYSQFPSPKRRDIGTREFPGYYPHGLHQSLMARDRRPLSQQTSSLIMQRISFRSAAERPLSDVCTNCHSGDERGSVPLPLKGIEREETLQRIEADTFKTIPGLNAHAACFTCHWLAQKPTKDECDGCHVSSSDYTTRKLAIFQPPALSIQAIKWFENWPAGLPKRFSLKFRHNTHTRSADGRTESNNHDLGCTTCHINIAQMTTLNIPKADVQIVSCAPCHATTAAIPTGQGRVTIFDEMQLKEDVSKHYTCIACHTSVIGREAPPCTHYSVIGQPCSKNH